MKPDARQIQTLKDYLHQTLVYREAYEEIYDHILSALEHQENNITYQEAINNIIRDDFGSPKNLLNIEKEIKNALVKDTVRRYFAYLSACFKFPGMIYTVTGALLSYYFFWTAKLSPMATFGIFAVLVAAPCVIWVMRLYNTGYILDTTRKSAKDKLFETFTGVPIRIALIPMLFVNLTGYKIWQNNNYYFITVFFMVGVLYNVALYRLYKNEFKSAAAK